MTNLTALIIASRTDIVIDAGYSKKDEKWAGWITLGPDDRYRPLVNTEPIYASKEEAVKDMDRLVTEIRHRMLREVKGVETK